METRKEQKERRRQEIMNAALELFVSKGYFIDNCIHWLTGTRPGSALHELWKEIGALGDDIELHKKEMFFSSKLNGQTLTFWRDGG